MNRPPAFVRPPNTTTGAPSTPYSNSPRITPQFTLNQNSFNVLPKAPPPFNYKQPSNQFNLSPVYTNGKNPNPALISDSMVNGHFPFPTEDSNSSKQNPPGVSKVQLDSKISPSIPGSNLRDAFSTELKDSTNVGNSPLNPNNSSNSEDANVLQQKTPAVMSFLASSQNTSASLSTAVRNNVSIQKMSIGADHHNENQQSNDIRSQISLNPAEFQNTATLAAPKSITPIMSNVQSVMASGIESISTTSNVAGPLVPVNQPRSVAPNVSNLFRPPTNGISSPQQSNTLDVNTVRSPYTPMVSQSSSSYFFPTTTVSQLYVSSAPSISQSTMSPNLQPVSLHTNISSGVLPSSNVNLQNMNNNPSYSVPATATSGLIATSSSVGQLTPIVSPSSNVPPNPRYFVPPTSAVSTSQQFASPMAGGFPPIKSPAVVTPFMGVPIPQNATKTAPPPTYMNSSQQIIPTEFTPISPGISDMQRLPRPPLGLINRGNAQPPMQQPLSFINKGNMAPPPMKPPLSSINKGIPPPPTSFQTQPGTVSGSGEKQSYSSLYSNPLAPYPASISSSQRSPINVGSNQYPIQQQPSSINPVSRQLGGLSVAHEGWNKGWGTTSVDLMQQRCLLPSGKVIPPKTFIAQENINPCSMDVFRCTFTKVPESNSVLQKARLPFGILIHPFKDIEKLTIVNGNSIVRCRTCRTYINPFIVFKGERKWECNLCFRVNDLPEEFQYDPVSRTYGDPSRRPECREGTIEYIAPQEYLLRPPQPACYLYVLDISRQAIETGYLQIACEVLLSRLGDIPGDKRTLVGFITFSTSIQFYMIAEDQKMVNVLDVGAINNVFLPSPQDLLVNLHENRELVEELLMSLPEDVANTYTTQSCLGAAITAAHKLLAPIGGRITVMAATLPTIGPGELKPREDPNQRAAKDINNLGPAIDFYKKYALDCSAQQIAVDLFTFNTQYIDLATITGISKFSGGCIHHFPGMNLAKNTPNVVQFRNCFDRYVSRKIGFEAVMRIRATRGLSITNFHGNFFVRSTDLLSLPNINPDAGFGMQVLIEEPLHNIRQACFQAALLYTSSQGERRIRVHTMCLPVSANILDIMISADQQAVIGFLSKLAVDRCLTSQMSDAREAIVNACADPFGAYKLAMSATSIGLVAPVCLQLLPMYCLSILKSISLRYGVSTKLDDRVYAMCELKSMPLKPLIQSFYPDLYAIHNLTEKGAIDVDDVMVPQPPRLHLSSEFIDRSGAYLMDAANVIIIYIRNYISPHWLNDVLGVPNFATIPQPMHDDPLPELDNTASELVRNFVFYLQMGKSYPVPLSIIKEDSPERFRFMQRLIEDRSEASHSYVEFLQYVKSQMK